MTTPAGNRQLFTDFQCHFFGHLLTSKPKSWSSDAVSPALASAEIDPVPHQIEATLFAIENPNSEGVLIADEVGLGKTIESGLVISQFWAEGKRSILIIVPTSIQAQWQKQLFAKFYLEATVVTNATYKGNEDAVSKLLQSEEKLIISNEFFAASKHKIIESARWDLVVIDEAHKFRNVWDPSPNMAKRAKLVRQACRGRKKLLLTATPIQNDLMELYGIMSLINEDLLGKQEWFQAVYADVPEEFFEARIAELKRRLTPVYRRELRNNVKDFINYTNRLSHSELFSPPDEEELLRRHFEQYIARDDIVGISFFARPLVRCTYLKLLASSTQALKNSLTTIFARVARAAVSIKDEPTFASIMKAAAEALTLKDGKKTVELEQILDKVFTGTMNKTYQGLLELMRTADPISMVAISDEEEEKLKERLRFEDDSEESLERRLEAELGFRVTREGLIDECSLVLSFIILARKIIRNEKANAFIKTLQKHMDEARHVGHPEKAVVYTEFRATQNFLVEILKENGWNIDRDVVVFNGSIPQDKRAELISDFKDKKKIFLSTEAGGEGLDLQFCNLVINYDLPWNPQRVEQRIGRCHRYGQHFDVVVVNFINTKNWADERVIELLDKKFSLFSGTFGASDSPIGTIDSPIDFERRLYEIYLKARTKEDIEKAFDQMLEESKSKREELYKKMQEQLLKFDGSVQRRIKQYRDLGSKTQVAIDRIQDLVRRIIESRLHSKIESTTDTSIRLSNGRVLKFSRAAESGEMISVFHEDFRTLVQNTNKTGHITFEYTNSDLKLAQVSSLVGHKGLLRVFKIEVSSLDRFEITLPIAFSSNAKGEQSPIAQDVLLQLIELPAKEKPTSQKIEPDQSINDLFSKTIEDIIAPHVEEMKERTHKLFREKADQIGIGHDIHIKYLDKKRAELDEKLRNLEKIVPKDIAEEKKIQTQKKRLRTEQMKLSAEQTRVFQEYESLHDKEYTELERKSEVKVSTVTLAEFTFEVK